MKWLWILLALLYLISRFDLVPDMIPLYGWIDDIAVLFFLFRYLNRQRRMQNGENRETRDHAANGQQTGQSGADRTRTGRTNSPKSPYDILNIPPSADEEQIRAAYRKLANQYHPDKVAHLGKEFQDLAESRFKEIQRAYELLVATGKRTGR